MIGSELMVAVVWGVLLTIFVEVLVVLLWIQAQPIVRPTKDFPPYKHPKSRDELQRQDGQQVESCHWLNLISDFIFHELRDSQETKWLIMKFIRKEFKELLLTKTEGKVIEELTVREYYLGDSLPLLSDILIIKTENDDDTSNKRPQLIEAELNVSYKGSFEIKIDAQLMFGRSAMVCLRLCRLEGRGRLQFTRDPFTCWSFAFLHDPIFEISVTSRFEGINLPRLSVFIESQIKRWLKRKHTLPGYKPRLKPFFRKRKQQDQLLDVYLHDELLTVGTLQVNIIECTRLGVVDMAVELYCTLSIDNSPQEPMVGLWKNVWPSHELTLEKSSPYEILGMKYVLYSLEDGKGSLVIVSQVVTNTPAYKAGLKRGDVLNKIESVKVTSVDQANKLVNKLSDLLKIIITVQRPPINLLRLKAHSTKSRSKSSERKSNFRKSRSQTVVEPRGLEEQEMVYKSDGETAPSRRSRGRRDQEFDTCSLQLNDTSVDQSITAATISEEHDAVIIPETPPSLTRPNLTTKSVAVNKSPQWNELFEFDIKKKHKYLNISVWCRLQGDEGDIMIGYVSLSLMDIAVECSMTSEGVHEQCYVLVPTKLSKINASRAALKVTSGHSELPATAKLSKLIGSKKYVGDIMLKFKHTPHEFTKEKKKRSSRKRKESLSEMETTESGKFNNLHPFTADKNCEPSRHQFKAVDLKRSEKRCHTCSSRIWKKAWQCMRCSIVSDTSCLEYCKTMVPCHGSRKGTEEVSSDEEQQLPTTSSTTDSGWVHLSSSDTYSDSRMIYKRTNEVDFGASVEVKEPIITVESVDETNCQNMTPPESDNSSSEGEDNKREDEREDKLLNQSREDSLSRESSKSPLLGTDDNLTYKELESKIIMAQEYLVLLSIEKQKLFESLNNTMTTEQRETINYKIQKNEAQHETTEEFLKLQKQKLRQMTTI